MSWEDTLKFNPFKARQKRKEEELKRERELSQRIADEQKRRKQRMNMTNEQFNQRMAEGDISEERKKEIDNYFGLNKRYPFRENRGESKFFRKRKLRALLDILNSDMEPSSKVAQAQGFVESMLKEE